MKIKYSELKRKTKKELLELKEILEVHNMRLENHITTRKKILTQSKLGGI